MTELAMTETQAKELALNLKPPKRDPSSLRFSQMTFDERLQLCTLMAGSTSIPKALQGNPANLYYIGERGDRIGLSLTESISCVYVVNGVTALWGDLPLALCRVSAPWVEQEFDEWIEVAGQRVDKHFDNRALGDMFAAGKMVIAYCKTKRKDAANPMVRSYSIQDAYIQGLDAKDTWKKSPRRMLQRRARGINLTDNFSDVLMGFVPQDIAEDTPPPREPATPLELHSQPDTKGAAIVEQAAQQITMEPGQQPAKPEPQAQPDPNVAKQVLDLEMKLCDTPEGTTAYKGIWASFKLPADKFQADSGAQHVPVENLGFYLKMLQAAQAGLGKKKKPA